MNLEQDFIKYETSGTQSYYGYNLNPESKDGDNNWSIRLLIDGDDKSSVRWSYKKLRYTSKWSNKEDYFVSPENNTEWLDSFTYSSTIRNNSFYSFNHIEINWDELPGVDIYEIRVISNGTILNRKGGPSFHNITDTLFSNNTDKMSYEYEGELNKEYSIEIKAINNFGEINKVITL